MNDPIAADKELVDKFKLDSNDITDPEKDFKMAYITAQLGEFKNMLYRTRVDIILTKNLVNSKDDALRNKGLQNEAEFTVNLKQTKQAIDTLIKLREQIKAGE